MGVQAEIFVVAVGTDRVVTDACLYFAHAHVSALRWAAPFADLSRHDTTALLPSSFVSHDFTSNVRE